jgi:hypothetical protein
VPLHLTGDPREHEIVREGAEQLVVALAGLVRSGENRIDDAERRGAADAPRRDARPRVERAVPRRRVLEGAGHGGPQRHDAASGRLRPRDRRNGRLGDDVRLVERKARVERRVPGRGQPGRVGQGRESDPSRRERRQHLPIQDEARRGGLECGRKRRDPRPHVPHLERAPEVRVLYGLAVARDSRPDRVGRAREANRHEPGMVVQANDRGLKRSEREDIPDPERRRDRPLLGPCPKVARPEHDDHDLPDVLDRKRAPGGETDFDRRCGPAVEPREARRDRRRVVGDEEVPGTQHLWQRRTCRVAQRAVGGGDEELRVSGALNGERRGTHARAPR